MLVFEFKTIDLRHGRTQVFFWLEFVHSYLIWSRLTQNTWDISASIQRPRRIRNCNFAHVRYIKILTWLRGLTVKIENFSRLQCPQFPEEAWAHRKLRACLHGSGRPQVGEVTRLGGVTRLSILSLVLILWRLHDSWGDHMRDCIDRRFTSPKQVTSPTWVPPTSM